MGKLPFLNEKIDYIGFIEKYLYMVLLLDEVEGRNSNPGAACEHSFSVDVIKEMALCNNNEAVKARRTLKSLGWVEELPERTHRLEGIKGRKKAPVRLINESRLKELSAYAETWQYRVVAGLLQCPPAGGWQMKPVEWGAQFERVGVTKSGQGNSKKIRGPHKTKLPIIERLALAALWAQASSVGRVDGISLNELARQCSLKPSRRFQLAVSHLIADGAIVYVQEKVAGGAVFGEGRKVPAEIQLNPFHPWVAENTPPVTLVTVEARLSEYMEWGGYPKALSVLTGIERLSEYGYWYLGGGPEERTKCLLAVAYAANPYTANVMNKKWSNKKREIDHKDILRAEKKFDPFTVPANIKRLHDDFIILQKLIREHMMLKIGCSLTRGELALSELLLDTSGRNEGCYSPLIQDRYKSKLEKLPFALQDIISKSERMFQDRLLEPLLHSLEKNKNFANVAALASSNMSVLPFYRPPVETIYGRKDRYIHENMQCMFLTDCNGKVKNKQVISLRQDSDVPVINNVNFEKDLSKF